MAINRKILNDEQAYGWGLVILHWLTALAIIGLYPLGLYIDTLTYYDPEYRTMPHWHKSIGMIAALVLAVRLAWRSFNPPPRALSQPRLLILATHAVHGLLYLLLLVSLVSGYMISTADGRPISVFNWFEVPALPALIENQEDVAGLIHYWGTTALVSLTGLHALAALKHHFIDKDETLKRISGLRQE